MPNVATARAVSVPPVVNMRRLDGADVLLRREPVAFIVAKDVLENSLHDALCRDFPRYREAGFFEHDPDRCGPTINALVDEIRSRAFADKLGEKLGIPQLATKPMLVHLSSLQNRRHGTIHTDSRATVATVLFYFNNAWPHGSAGCLRFLGREDDIEAMIAPEVKPLFGTMVAFRRSDISYHGFLPYEGERMVIKAAWIVSREELDRKQRRNRTTHLFKKVLGPIDRWFDSGRDASKAHKD